MRISKKSLLILSSIVIFFLPQSSYANINIKYSDGFDFPLGLPDGVGYSLSDGLTYLQRWDYSRDGVAEYHPGEDWNDDNSGNDFGSDKNDAGDPVYSVSNGVVLYAKYSEENWGYLVLIEHTMKDGSKYWSQYAHLKNINIKYLNKSNIPIDRGSEIGKIGDYKHGSGRAYHLHFEIRKKYRPATAFVMDWSKEQVEEYYVNPSEFINTNRPAPPEPPGPEYEITNLTNTIDRYERNQKIGGGKVIWEMFGSEQDHFPYRSTLYYYELETGENSEIKIGSLIDPIEGPHLTEINNNHFCYMGKTSRYSVNNIFCHNIESGTDMQITNSFYHQMYPALSESGYLVWLDTEEDTLYYTNIYSGTEITKVYTTPNQKYQPRVWGNTLICKEYREAGVNDLYIVDLVTNEVIYMIPDTGYGLYDVWEDWVVWVDGGVITLYNYVTHEEKIISEVSFGIPRMQNGKVVWERNIDGYSYMNIYNIESGDNLVVDIKLKYSAEPYIFENYITFKAPDDPLSDYAGSMDIWLIKF